MPNSSHSTGLPSMPSNGPPVYQLTEHLADWRTEELTIDREKRLVRNVALARAESRNGYHYRAEALQSAVPLYSDKPVFLDHAERTAAPVHRSTRDLVGSIINPRFEHGLIRGDIRVIDTEAGRTFLALVENNGPAVGMSHVVLAERSADQSEVTRIADVLSVDAVVFPASTSNFQERQETAAAVETADAATEDQSTAMLHRELATLRDERDQLAAEVDVERRLRSADLPAHAVTELFREQLRCSSPSRRQQLIDERLELVHYAANEETSSTSTESQTALKLLRERQQPKSYPRRPASRQISNAQLVQAIKTFRN